MGMAPAGVTGVVFQLGPEDDPVEIPVVDGVFVSELAGSADQTPTRVDFIHPGDDDDALGKPPADDAGGCSAAAGGAGGAGLAALLALTALLGLGRGRRRRIA